MNWKNRLTNYNFWVSIVSAIILVLQALKVKFDVAYINEIVTAVLGLLVVIGIINDPTKTYTKTNQTKTEDNLKEKTNEELITENEQKIFENLKNNTKFDKNFEKTSQNLENLEKNLQIENNNLAEETKNLQLENLKMNMENLNDNFNKLENGLTNLNDKPELIKTNLTENLIPNNAENEIVIDPVQNNLQANEIENLNAEFSEDKIDN